MHLLPHEVALQVDGDQLNRPHRHESFGGSGHAGPSCGGSDLRESLNRANNCKPKIRGRCSRSPRSRHRGSAEWSNAARKLWMTHRRRVAWPPPRRHRRHRRHLRGTQISRRRRGWAFAYGFPYRLLPRSADAFKCFFSTVKFCYGAGATSLSVSPWSVIPAHFGAGTQ
jgi:hypothetical protein